MSCQGKYQGLTNLEAERRLQRFGSNELHPRKKTGFFHKAVQIIREPMFLLLIIAALIYFSLGAAKDGAVMLVFVLAIIGIDVFQQWRTDRTLHALRDLSQPKTTVIREGLRQQIASTELVPGDLMEIIEGNKIPADGVIIEANDLCLDESSLTGEAEAVWKEANQVCDDDYWRQDYCYAGTLVLHGYALVEVEKTGTDSEYGKIGAALAEAKEKPTPLQRQIRSLVKFCAWLALGLCLLVAVVTFGNLEGLLAKERLVGSLLSGITLAMAMIPEEFPVILTVFLSLGAWRLAKKGSLIRHLPSTETLGSVSVLCVDKTGTLTMNKMQVEEIWLPEPDSDQRLFTETAVLACESNAYNPMEIAILQYVREQGIEIVAPGEMVKEYSFTNESKMMAHVWRRGQGLLIAAKGSPETLCSICEMSGEQRQAVAEAMQKFSMQGLRVLALAEDRVKQEEDLPADLQDCSLHFLGLIAFSDPPRRHIQADIAQCRRAGVRVMMITGDNGDTAAAIAREVGISSSKIITGTMLELMDDEQLAEAVGSADIFARVLPGHKMRIVRALQGNGEIVAMTGDGVNDASALKYADIGIAMGKRGSEVAREAADLVLLDDDFSTIVDSIRDGRRIYDNIRKAMVYVLAIHVPIALASLLAPMLGIAPTALLLLPFHIMLLELIIDPTCSVVLERQPAEEDVMDKRPRNPKESIITKGLLIKGLMQGLVIFAAAFGSYYTLLQAHPAEPELARSFALAIIIIANLFLVQVNSSYQQSAWQTMKKLRQDKVVRGSIIATCLMLGIILYSPLNGFLKLAPLGLVEMLLVIVIASASVLWYEVVKLIRRQRNAFPQTNNML